MATRATQKTVVEKISVGNLFLLVPDTDFCDFLEEVEELKGFKQNTLMEVLEPSRRALLRHTCQLQNMG